ncbi:hypothetical protein [Anaerococcus sp. Marseille-P3625]|uniref:hypothetical protein n=1 Tax=Anaerococcus sp. Marseille-P3625 TaxID=1977277 RepID=UPI000C084C22|nr:hypothetical protein [Anaerococcus sp. Marseille-P3625]
MKSKLNIDEFGIFLVWMGIIFSLISYFTKSTFLNSFGFVIFVFAIYRSFSRQTQRRALENEQFKEKFINPIKKAIKNGKNDATKLNRNKDFKYIACPNCGQKLRIPKKKGNVKVRCPKCGEKFDARS